MGAGAAWIRCLGLLGLMFMGGHADALELQINGSTVRGIDQGRTVWRYNAVAPVQVETRRDGTYLVNGTDLLDGRGRLLARTSKYMAPAEPIFDATSQATATLSWTAPEPLVVTSLGFDRPVFDDAGNAWIVVADTANNTSIVEESVGTSGTWQQKITLPSQEYALDGSIAVDAQGNVTVVAIDSDGTNAVVNAVRYQPSSGWSAPKTLFSTPLPHSGDPIINNIYVVTDSNGDAIVATDPIPYGAIYIVYSQAQQNWLPFQQFSLPLAPASVPTANEIALSQSPNRQHIQFSYAAAVQLQAATGLYTNAFDLSTLTFGSPVLVAGTKYRVGYYVNHGDQIIASVDNDGAINVVWPRTANGAAAGTWASRYSSGHWKRAIKVTTEVLGLDTFTAQSLDENGNFLVSTPDGNGSTQTGYLVVVKFTKETGWSIANAASWSGSLITHTAISWLGSSGEAVGIFLIAAETSVGYSALSYAVWDGSEWSASAPVSANPTYYSFFQSAAASPQGAAVLAFDPLPPDEEGNVSNVYGAFMLP